VSVRGPNGIEIGRGYLVAPWNSWFQQFSQKSPNIVSITISPYTANASGTLIISGTAIFLTRGLISIALGNGQKIIPISIGDTVSWATASAVQFLGA
jgi:hypothetical protein